MRCFGHVLLLPLLPKHRNDAAALDPGMPHVGSHAPRPERARQRRAPRRGRRSSQVVPAHAALGHHQPPRARAPSRMAVAERWHSRVSTETAGGRGEAQLSRPRSCRALRRGGNGGSSSDGRACPPVHPRKTGGLTLTREVPLGGGGGGGGGCANCSENQGPAFFLADNALAPGPHALGPCCCLRNRGRRGRAPLARVGQARSCAQGGCAARVATPPRRESDGLALFKNEIWEPASLLRRPSTLHRRTSRSRAYGARGDGWMGGARGVGDFPDFIFWTKRNRSTFFEAPARRGVRVAPGQGERAGEGEEFLKHRRRFRRARPAQPCNKAI